MHTNMSGNNLAPLFVADAIVTSRLFASSPFLVGEERK